MSSKSEQYHFLKQLLIPGSMESWLRSVESSVKSYKLMKPKALRNEGNPLAAFSSLKLARVRLT